jgi:hypothetical protein
MVELEAGATYAFDSNLLSLWLVEKINIANSFFVICANKRFN